RTRSNAFGIEDPHRIELHVGFENGAFDRTERMAAAIVAAIGNDHQRFTVVARLLHQSQGHLNRVKEGGSTEGPCVIDLMRQQLNVFGKRYSQPGTVIEFDEKKLVV